jgi:hypothetical protein
MAWGVTVFFSTVMLRLLYDRANPMEWVHDLAVPTLVLALVHAGFAILWLMLFDSWPRYDVYLEIVAGGGAGWALNSFPTTSPTWLAVGILYFVGIALGLAEGLRGRGDGSDSRIVTVAFPIAIAGAMQMFYWVARPYEGNLFSTFVPGVILGALSIDRLCDHIRYSSWRTFEGRLSAAIGILIVVSLFALINVQAMRRAQAIWAATPSVRAYIDAKAAYLRGLKQTPMRESSYDPVSFDMARMIREHQPGGQYVVLFIRLPCATPVLLLTDKIDAFGRSNQNDENSPTYMSENLKRALNLIGPGSLVFMESSIPDFMAGRRIATSVTDTFTPFDYRAYQALISIYDLCVLEKSKIGNLVAVVRPKPADCERP